MAAPINEQQSPPRAERTLLCPMLFAEAEAAVDEENWLTGAPLGYVQSRGRHAARLIAVRV